MLVIGIAASNDDIPQVVSSTNIYFDQFISFSHSYFTVPYYLLPSALLTGHTPTGMMATGSRVLHITSRLSGACHTPPRAYTYLGLRDVCLPQPLHQPMIPACLWTAAAPAIHTPSLHTHHHQCVTQTALRRPLTTTYPMLMSSQEQGRIKQFIKKMGWLDHSKSVSVSSILYHYFHYDHRYYHHHYLIVTIGSCHHHLSHCYCYHHEEVEFQ